MTRKNIEILIEYYNIISKSNHLNKLNIIIYYFNNDDYNVNKYMKNLYFK